VRAARHSLFGISPLRSVPVLAVLVMVQPGRAWRFGLADLGILSADLGLHIGRFVVLHQGATVHAPSLDRLQAGVPPPLWFLVCGSAASIPWGVAPADVLSSMVLPHLKRRATAAHVAMFGMLVLLQVVEQSFVMLSFTNIRSKGVVGVSSPAASAKMESKTLLFICVFSLFCGSFLSRCTP
jgi:hypothetical protein